MPTEIREYKFVDPTTFATDRPWVRFEPDATLSGGLPLIPEDAEIIGGGVVRAPAAWLEDTAQAFAHTDPANCRTEVRTLFVRVLVMTLSDEALAQLMLRAPKASWERVIELQQALDAEFQQLVEPVEPASPVT